MNSHIPLSVWYNGTYRLVNHHGHNTSVSAVVVGTRDMRHPDQSMRKVLFADGSDIQFSTFKELVKLGRLVKR